MKTEWRDFLRLSRRRFELLNRSPRRPRSQPLFLRSRRRPLLLVFAFRTVPRLSQRWHEDRFIKIPAGSTVTRGGSYFLIRPYKEEERERYTRADGMHTAVFDWCRRTNESILILTGLSGTGKSSLLSAFVIPALREGKSPSTVVLVRSFDNPLDELRKNC